jgi:hypothetical protein
MKRLSAELTRVDGRVWELDLPFGSVHVVDVANWRFAAMRFVAIVKELTFSEILSIGLVVIVPLGILYGILN